MLFSFHCRGISLIHSLALRIFIARRASAAAKHTFFTGSGRAAVPPRLAPHLHTQAFRTAYSKPHFISAIASTTGPRSRASATNCTSLILSTKFYYQIPIFPYDCIGHLISLSKLTHSRALFSSTGTVRNMSSVSQAQAEAARDDGDGEIIDRNGGPLISTRKPEGKIMFGPWEVTPNVGLNQSNMRSLVSVSYFLSYSFK